MKGFVAAALAVFLMYCATAGFFWTIWAVVSDWGPFAWFWREYRRVNTVRDDIVRSIISDLVTERSNWVSKMDGWSEIITRSDGKIILENYDDPKTIRITVEGLGKFHATDLRPSATKALSGAAVAFKDYCGLLAVHNRLVQIEG